MARTRKLFATAAAGLAVLSGTAALAGCSKVSPEEFKAELVKAGMKDSLAQCIVDEMKKQNIVIERYTEASKEQLDQVGKLSADCAAKDLGIDPKTLGSIPAG